MPEPRSAFASSHPVEPPLARWPIAPWRIAVLLLCFTLAAWAARLAWLESHADRAQAADPELMLLVAQRWAATQSWNPGPAPAAEDEAALTAQRRDMERVLALLSEQQRLEPGRSDALVAPRDRWAQAQQALLVLSRPGSAAADIKAAASAAAATSHELMLALRQRAEQRHQPDAGSAQPGVMLAVASLGLLLVGWRLPRRSAQLVPLDSRLEEPPPSVLPSFLPSVLPDPFPGALPELEDQTLLLALQLEMPATVLADLPASAAEAAGELERLVKLRLRSVLPGASIARTEPIAGALRLDLQVVDPGSIVARRGLVQRVFEEMADAYTAFDHPVSLPASLGVVEPECTVAEHAVRDAHATRDLASDQGGGIVFFSPELGQRLAASRAMNTALLAAIGSGAMQLEYQPVAELSSGRLIGLRAEPVWQHAERGRLGHAEFMPEAEAHGCGALVADFVWRTALAQLAAWRRSLHERCPPCVAVPGWACVWQRGDLLPFVQGLLAEAGVPASALQVSLAEPLLAADDALPQQVKALRALGVAVVLEGLGHASASLSWLARLPVSAVAIDRMFVAELPGHEAHQMLVQAIVSLADAQGLVTYADGVQRPEQRDALMALGVQAAHGPWLSESLTAQALEAWLHKTRH